MIFYLLLSFSALTGNETYIPAWGKCGGKDWNKTTTCCDFKQYCLYSNDQYSECVNLKPEPQPPAPATETCGAEGKTWNGTSAALTSREIAKVWVTATTGLTKGRHAGQRVPVSS